MKVKQLRITMTKNNNIKYDILETEFCGQLFPSIRVDDVDYFPVSALPKDVNGINGFPVRQNEVTTDLKRILGNDFQSAKFLTDLNPRKVVCVDEDTLAKLVSECAFSKGSTFCRDLLEASFAVMLRQANDVARGEAEKAEYYVELAALRAAGIKYRRQFTDMVKMQRELGFDLNYGYMTILVYRCTDLIAKYNAWKQVYTTKAERAKNPFRGTLNQLELNKLNDFELRAACRAKAKNISIIQAIKDTDEFFN